MTVRGLCICARSSGLRRLFSRAEPENTLLCQPARLDFAAHIKTRAAGQPNRSKNLGASMASQAGPSSACVKAVQLGHAKCRTNAPAGSVVPRSDEGNLL